MKKRKDKKRVDARNSRIAGALAAAAAAHGLAVASESESESEAPVVGDTPGGGAGGGARPSLGPVPACVNPHAVKVLAAALEGHSGLRWSVRKCVVSGCKRWAGGASAVCSCGHGAASHVLKPRAHTTLDGVVSCVKAARCVVAACRAGTWGRRLIEAAAVSLKGLDKMPSEAGVPPPPEDLQRQLFRSLQAAAVALDVDDDAAGTCDAEAAVRASCHLDDAYHRLYYHHLTSLATRRAADAIIPPPHQYFPTVSACYQGGKTAVAAFVRACQSDPLELPVAPEVGGDPAAAKKRRLGRAEDVVDPLTQVLRARFVEFVAFFHAADGVATARLFNKTLRSRAKAGGRKPAAPKRAVGAGVTGGSPCFALLQLWRDACRDWSCHLYAYACPSPAALDAVAAAAPGGVIEHGAGTGYWSALLRARGVDVVAYDVAPPAVSATHNEYHGTVPCWTPVSRGTPDVPVPAGRSTLFLCYPPPDSSLAYDALSRHTGDVLVYVGEFAGDTGDKRFETALFDSWTMEQEVLLPNFTNTAYSLTVWRRGRAGATTAPATMTCRMSGTPFTAGTLRRCLYCRTMAYCSASHAAKDARRHAMVHAAMGLASVGGQPGVGTFGMPQDDEGL